MPDIFLNPGEQGMVEFKTWKSLVYKKRMFLGFTLILAGFIIQYFTFSIFPGILVLFLGNLLLLPKGVANMVKTGTFDARATWEKIEEHKLDEYINFEKKLQKWDRSAVDASNPLGGCLFTLLLGVIMVVGIIALADESTVMGIIVLDAAVLLLLYWVTGLKTIYTVPMVSKEIKLIKAIVSEAVERLKLHKIDYYMLLNEKKVPKEVKFKVNIAGQHQDFLGYYGQVSINRGVFLYFYVVMVAKKGFGLDFASRAHFSGVKTIVKEYKEQDDVEVLVLRQDTKAVANGYITSEKQALNIFINGLDLAEKIALKPF